MALDPLTDGSGFGGMPTLNAGLLFRDYGSGGLRQYGGWVREEYLPNLVGRQGAAAYREMLDGSAVIGGMIFAIKQTMRKVEWRVTAPDKGAGPDTEVKFVQSLMMDMSHTWADFIDEALSMLGYGYAPHEIVYKRRLGPAPHRRNGPHPGVARAGSRYDDGRIGWRRLPLRGQDTIIKWFFDENGQIKGMTQQPWVGQLLDIPIEKLLLFRPNAHKNNPEGRSVLRNAYRSWFFAKRIEEQEAIMVERMNGYPVMYAPSALMEKAASPGNTPDVAQAQATVAAYKTMLRNIRVDEQMGALLPSDVYRDGEGKPTNVRMYELQLLTPTGGKATGTDTDKIISRHKIDMMMTLLCDFLMMGHEVRGTNNLAITKVDMFYSAIEGWLNGMADIFNRHALPRLWYINGLDPALMPTLEPDMSQRLDLDSLGAYIGALAAAGAPLFPDEELQTFLREAAGLPAATSPEAVRLMMDAAKPDKAATLKKMIMADMARIILKNRGQSPEP